MLTVNVSGTETPKDASRHRAVVGTCAVAAEAALRRELRFAMVDHDVERTLCWGLEASDAVRLLPKHHPRMSTGEALIRSAAFQFRPDQYECGRARSV
jgi:hypothetical protein